MLSAGCRSDTTAVRTAIEHAKYDNALAEPGSLIIIHVHRPIVLSFDSALSTRPIVSSPPQ